MKLTTKEKKELLPELRKIYALCEENGHTPSAVFVKLGKVLKSEVEGDSDDADTYYHNQSRDQIEDMLESIETNIEMEGRGGTEYSDKEKQFIEDMRGRFHEKSDWSKPLTGAQVRWLTRLYERS
jgi:hypothetical protein